MHNKLFTVPRQYVIAGFIISVSLYLALVFNSFCYYGDLGGFTLVSPRFLALSVVAWSLLPWVWFTCLFMISQPWLKVISAVGFVVFSFVTLILVVVEHETIVTDHDDLRKIIAEKRIDDQSRSVTYIVDVSYRQEWIEKKIFPGIIWCKRLSSERLP